MAASKKRENKAQAKVTDLKKSSQDFYQQCDATIRSAPVPYVLGATGVGFFLRFFPITCVLSAFFRLTMMLLRPAILILGLIKLAEIMKDSCHCKTSEVETTHQPLVDSPPGPSGH